MSVIAECHNSTHNSSCEHDILVHHNITLLPCVDKGCGLYGKCYMYYSGVIHWSVCKCKAGKFPDSQCNHQPT